MPQMTPEKTRIDQTQARRDAFERLTRMLDVWRVRTDELMVQLDLANLDVRDEICECLDATENVYLAARARLSGTRHPASPTSVSKHADIEQVIRDLHRAHQLAQTVLQGADGDRSGTSARRLP